jgi:thiamine kinase-like enzyme
MYAPSLNLLRTTVSSSIQHTTVELIKHSSTPAVVYRLRLERESEQRTLSLVVKRIKDGWPEDPEGHKREVCFYRHLLPQLDIPHPHIYYAGSEPDTSAHLVIMEDVSLTHRFPAPQHTWTQTEIKQILRTYARLHTSGQDHSLVEEESAWLMDRYEKRLFETSGDVPYMVEALVAKGVWPKMPGFGSLLEQTLRNAELFSEQPVTVLHGDVFPPNCSLPLAGEDEVILVDWDMVSFGLAEMDLAFMFMQPFNSHRLVNRREALAYYWHRRQMLGGKQRSKAERKLRQQYADALWALRLVPVAYRMSMSPFPLGSAPRNYWDSMFSVLGACLHELSHEI